MSLLDFDIGNVARAGSGGQRCTGVSLTTLRNVGSPSSTPVSSITFGTTACQRKAPRRLAFTFAGFALVGWFLSTWLGAHGSEVCFVDYICGTWAWVCSVARLGGLDEPKADK
jgi:hypothetical protein